MMNFFSPQAIFFLIILLSNVSFGAEDLTIKQQILMPGSLVKDHADLESKCESCHSNFSKNEMATLCLDCHKDIAADRKAKEGFHGSAPLAAKANCETCHKDHEGRDEDIVGLNPETFDHSKTRFVLEGPHQFAACPDCHKDDIKFRDTESTCVSCHKDKDIHKGVLGEQCESCHQSAAWSSLKPFDHSKTDFILEGEHKNIACNTCHLNQKFEFPETTCSSCHARDDVHENSNGSKCQDCHSSSGWNELKFDHDKTDFPLHGRHSDIPCQACHSETSDSRDARKDTPTECNGCHSTDDKHLGRNGTECNQCHVESDWLKVSFDHEKDTDYSLTGKHQKLPCTQCHTGKLTDQLPRDCGGCHAGDDVHKDPSMTLCGTCHNTDDWNKVSQFDHDFTEFPLVGMHQIVPCQNCHIGNQFALSNPSCVGCHEKEDVHENSLGKECHTCHSPNAWTLWEFDHDTLTDYPLTGNHSGLSCNSCHKPDTSPENTPNQCGSCHRQDDIHNGEFGNRCNRCHDTKDFKNLIIQ